MTKISVELTNGLQHVFKKATDALIDNDMLVIVADKRKLGIFPIRSVNSCIMLPESEDTTPTA